MSSIGVANPGLAEELNRLIHGPSIKVQESPEVSFGLFFFAFFGSVFENQVDPGDRSSPSGEWREKGGFEIAFRSTDHEDQMSYPRGELMASLHGADLDPNPPIAVEIADRTDQYRTIDFEFDGHGRCLSLREILGDLPHGSNSLFQVFEFHLAESSGWQ